MIDTRDILYKAAEDVQSGMWCKGHYYLGADTAPDMLLSNMGGDVEDVLGVKRCALGSIGLATKLLGGAYADYHAAHIAVDSRLSATRGFRDGVIAYNDDVLPDDPFEPGQQLASLFRETADQL